MKYMVTFDIGTTAVKGVLVSSKGEVVYSESKSIDTIFYSDYKEQSPDDWYQYFCEISKNILNQNIDRSDILGIIMSGQMQDLIVIDNDHNPVKNAILYSDGRATDEAEYILKSIGKETIVNSTGNNFDGTMPFAKLLWLKNNEPEIYNEIYKILISSKDYCVLKLTDEFATDFTSAATSGMMDIRGRKFNDEWLDSMDLNSDILPQILYPGDIVGFVTEKASIESGFDVGTKVYTGIGDAGATTLASGIKNYGEVNINLGTSGWVATISDDVIQGEGVFNLVAADKGLYINVVPFLNAGNVHKWLSDTLGIGQNVDKYENIKKLLTDRTVGSNDLIFLPYIVGERFPVLDEKVRGCYYGITPVTSKEDLVSAPLEGVAFSIRQGLERISKDSRKITLIGGAAREENWCQILSDVLGKNIMVFTNTEFLPAIAIADLVFKENDSPIENHELINYSPNTESIDIYDDLFVSFKELYPRLKGI